MICPSFAAQYTALQAICTKKIKFAVEESEKIKLKSTYINFYQIQEQLDNTQKEYWFLYEHRSD